MDTLYKECTTCKERKFKSSQFKRGMDECKACERFFCAACQASKAWQDFSRNQMEKGDQRKCRSCTGQGSSTLVCTECEKALPLSLFRKDFRHPAICNECRSEMALEEQDNMQALTGDYIGHGVYDTLTGADDMSGV